MKQRLGGWESEAKVGNFFRGWLGQDADAWQAVQELESQEEQKDYQDEYQSGGGVETYQSMERSMNIGPEAEYEEFEEGDITSSILATRAGAANIARFVPNSFIRTHPNLERFINPPSSFGGLSLPSWKLTLIAIVLVGFLYWKKL